MSFKAFHENKNSHKNLQIYSIKLQNFFELSQEADLCCQADRHPEGWTDDRIDQE